MKPIAMKCNQEQFESIKPKLDSLQIAKQGYHVHNLSYLTTNYGSNMGIVGFCGAWNRLANDRYCYETWNEQIFLEACGIKTNNDMKITKEQVSRIHNLSSLEGKKYIKELFPDAFKTELIVGKWYWFKNTLFNYQLDNDVYGFNKGGSWCNIKCWSWPKEYGYDREATNEEVFEALKNEAVKRGYQNKHIRLIRCAIGDISMGKLNDNFYRDNLTLMNNSYTVFCDGQWAEIIQVKEMTQYQIENELGYKIKIV